MKISSCLSPYFLPFISCKAPRILLLWILNLLARISWRQGSREMAGCYLVFTALASAEFRHCGFSGGRKCSSDWDSASYSCLRRLAADSPFENIHPPKRERLTFLATLQMPASPKEVYVTSMWFVCVAQHTWKKVVCQGHCSTNWNRQILRGFSSVSWATSNETLILSNLLYFISMPSPNRCFNFTCRWRWEK